MPLLDFPLVLEDVYLATRTVNEPRMAPGGDLIAYTELRLDRKADDRLSRIVVLARDGEEWAEAASFDGGTPRWSPAGDVLAFFDGRHADGPGIFRWSPQDGRPVRLADAAGVSELAWRPDGQAIAFVAASPVEDPAAPVAIRHVPIWTNGRALGAGPDQLHLLELAGGSVRRWVETDYDVCSLAWRPTGGTLAFCGGHQAHLPSHVYLLDEGDGAAPRAVTPEEGEAEQVTWTPDGQRLVVTGKLVARSVGQRELFVLDPSDGELRRLAADVDLEVDVVHYPLWHGSVATVEPDGAHVLFTAYEGAEVSLFRTPIDGGGPSVRLLGEPFEAVGITTVAGEELLTAVADPRTCGEIELLRRDGSRKRLTDVAGGVLDGVVQPEYRQFIAPDGTAVHGILLRGADPSTPGPLLVNVHGGPHYAYVAAVNEQDLHNWEFAARGWNVLMLNPRGSIGYGQDYFRGVLNGWCERDMDDFMSAIDALVAEGVADPDRLCLTGYSYGGIMANYLLAHTDRFRAAVSSAGFCDFTDMYATAAVGVGLIANELGGRPWERQELYDRLSPIRLADRIATPVLFMHGTEDRTTPLSGSEKLYTALRDLGRETELVVYPGCNHVYATWPLSLRLDYDRRLVEWMERHTA